MKPTVRRRREWMGTLIDAGLAGAILGAVAQYLRQGPGVLTSLGHSTAPWVMIGFLLAVSAARGAGSPRKGIGRATGTVAVYLVAWLLVYHLLFVLIESLSPVAGWRDGLPWLVAVIPAAPLLGAIAALSHQRGLFGDVCLVAPIAWALPEALWGGLRDGWSVSAAVVLPVAVLAVLLMRMAAAERRVNAVTLLTAAIAVGAVGAALYPVVRMLIPN